MAAAQGLAVGQFVSGARLRHIVLDLQVPDLGLVLERVARLGLTPVLRDEYRGNQICPLLVGKPMIAAINGACAGIGLMQTLMCDVRIAVTGARPAALRRVPRPWDRSSINV